MVVGVPKEVKGDEYRVAVTPNGVEELTRAGHCVVIQANAGVGSGIADAEYAACGAEVVASAAEVWSRADLVVKVKEPLPEEWAYLRPGLTVFTYFHFAADEKLTRAVLESGATAVAYETIRDAKGTLPLLTPMSEVAGRMSIQEGAKFWSDPLKVAAFCSAVSPGSPRRRSLSSGAESSVRMRRRSPPGSGRMCLCSTSISTVCGISMT